MNPELLLALIEFILTLRSQVFADECRMLEEVLRFIRNPGNFNGFTDLQHGISKVARGAVKSIVKVMMIKSWGQFLTI